MSTIPNQDASSMSSAIAPTSRRSLLKMAALGGLAAAGSSLLTAPVRAAGTTTSTEASIQKIFSILLTAEQLSVTFYRTGFDNAAAIGIHGESLDYLLAALVHEQLHADLFAANGGTSLADTFSFPYGAETFTNQQYFFETEQMLDGVADTAVLAAVRELADLGQSSLAQIMAQTVCVEQEHRALGRLYGGLGLADNRAYTPVLVAYVADAPAALKAAGFMSPAPGNTFRYIPVDFSAQDFAVVYPEVEYKAPVAARPYSLPSPYTSQP